MALQQLHSYHPDGPDISGKRVLFELVCNGEMAFDFWCHVTPSTDLCVQLGAFIVLLANAEVGNLDDPRRPGGDQDVLYLHCMIRT